MHSTRIQSVAFSLVELSIVLVILGLLVGGVLSGQSLIRASELRSVSTEYQKYASAAITFKDKYFAVPGDIPNATAFWGLAAGTGTDNTCADFSSIGTKATCNGNGDGYVFWDNVTVFVYEEMRFWQHLSNANLIEGQFSGTWDGPAPSYAEPGYNVGRTKFDSTAYWYAWGGATWGTTTTDFGGNLGNVFMFFVGNDTTVFRPEEVWNIDVKQDDGKPGSGFVMTMKGDAANPCTSNANVLANDPNATYNVQNPNKICTVMFTRQF